MGYRHHLSEIFLFNPHPSDKKVHGDDKTVMKGIMGLLSAQERGGSRLNRLFIDDDYVLELFKYAAEGAMAVV